MDFSKLLKEHAKTNLIAHEFRESTMTYRELEHSSNALAVALINQYGEDKTPIVVYGHKEHKMLISFVACIKSGHPYIPIDSSTPLERIKDILDISGTKLLINSGGKEVLFDNIKVLSSEDVDEFIETYSDQIPEERYCVKDEDIHYIIYTSGSTGKPKGVKITANCLSSFVDWASKFWDFNKGGKHVVMNQAPFSFDLSVMDLYLSLFSGSRLYSIDKEMIGSLKQLFSYFKKSDIDVWVSTPSFAEMCLSDSSFNPELLPKLKLMLFCGETLSNSCVRKLQERFDGVRIINTYGPTEATVAVTSVEVDRTLCETTSPLPVGYIKDECEIYIVKEVEGENKEEGRYLEFGTKKYLILQEKEKGEIVISGKSVSPGYLNNDEVTNKVFLSKMEAGEYQRYYRTGDEGYIEDGLLYYNGRIDFQVKLNGFRIELEDIESNLTQLDFIKSAVVLPVMKDDKPYYLAAVVTLSQQLSEKEFTIGLKIKEALKKKLPEYMVPRKIIFKDILPMTPNGKINRKLLMEELK